MTLPVTRRRFDALVARLYAAGVLDGEDLVLLHQLPWSERVPYLVARAQAAVDESPLRGGMKEAEEGRKS